MNPDNSADGSGLPEDLKRCVSFHGHLCPGLIYGYRVAVESIRLLDLSRSHDEEVVAVCENDSCAIDALQVLLGTTAGKGNLIIKNYGKNAYTIFNRLRRKGYRFSRSTSYRYRGPEKEEFDRLDQAMADQTADIHQQRRLKELKVRDLLNSPFEDVFACREVEYDPPAYASLAKSQACSQCGEMTMATKMIVGKNGALVCIPCSESGRML